MSENSNGVSCCKCAQCVIGQHAQNAPRLQGPKRSSCTAEALVFCFIWQSWAMQHEALEAPSRTK